MIGKKSFDILILEPVLDDRKEIAKLFQSSSYNVTFVETVKEAAEYIKELIPHLLLANLDHDKKSILKGISRLLEVLPKEIIFLGMAKELKAKHVQQAKLIGVEEVFGIPIKGKVTFDKIKYLLEGIEPLSVTLSSPTIVEASTNAEVIGLGETDYIIECGITPIIGEKLNINCPLVEDVLSEKKVYVVTQNKHQHLDTSFKHFTLTMLGLKNNDLQLIRSKILHWDKL